MTWARGREDIERLLADGELERVTPSPRVSDRLLRDADAHVLLATRGAKDDPAGALQLAYDAARKASAALLAFQGLRATSRGGHIAVLDAVTAQFSGGKSGIPAFGRINRLRRRRNLAEYPSEDSPGVTEEDAAQALTTAREAVDAAKRLIESGQLSAFG